jgi:DNA-binding transcriptional regulator of glucitol operon
VRETVAPQLSVSDGVVNVATAVQSPASVFILRGVGQVSAGFSLSVTVIVNEQDAELLAASVAVKTTVFVPFGNAEPLAKPLVRATVAPQLSVAVGVVNVATAVQSPASVFRLIGVGQVSAGFSLSVTVTVNEQDAELLEASVAVKTTVFVPFGKAEPLAKPLVRVTVALQLSVAVGVVNVATAVQSPASVFILRGDGQVSAGFSVSDIVTVNEQLVVPQELVTVTVTLVTPTLNVLPLPSPLPLAVVAPVKAYVTVGAGLPPIVGV